jgi:serine/threonine protein kinase
MGGSPFELEGFEPLSRIGSGGFGEVWLARQSNIDRRVAVKVGHTPIADETVQLRFERECIALGRLSGHPNIVDVFTAGRLADGRPYLVLEYVGGGTLWQRLRRQPLSDEELRTLGIQLADALSVAHAAGILHRDLKPENVLLRPNGDAVLSDFGIARLHDSAHTSSHAITASVAYAAPEVLSGKDASTAADIYGIGICLLACSLRAVPFVEKSDDSIHPIINRVLTARPPDLHEQGMSEGLAAIVTNLLAKDPEKRPSSASEVKDQLEALSLGPSDTPVFASATRTVGPPTAATGDLEVRAGSWLHHNRSAPGNGDGAPGSTGLRSRADRVRVFGAALGATLLIGGLILFGLSRLGDDSAAPQVSPTAPGSDSSISPVTEPRPPLVLPLSVADSELGQGATQEPDDTGPAASQFCGNAPAADGLVEWEGSTMATSVGLPLIVQQLSRFDSPAVAAAYVEAWVGTVNCTEWTIPARGDTPEIILLPVVTDPGTSYGDEAHEVLYAGTAGGVPLYSRNAIVRHDTDVYTLSLTSLNESDLTTLDNLLELAVSRLEF